MNPTKRFGTLFFLAALALGALSAACGDDDENANPTPAVDGGPPPVVVDSGANPTCTFATYVINLVNTQTNATAKPDTTLGEGCSASTSQDEFKSLFP